MGLTSEKISTAKDSKTNRSFFPQKEKSKSLFFQPSLTIGPVDDVYEREADAVADKVMRMSDTEQVQTKSLPFNIRRKCASCDEEEQLQRKEVEKSDEELEAPSIVSDALGSGGNPLDDNSRSFMENRFGYDFSNVKIHADAVAGKSAQSINALAYTSGNNIVFNEGQYSPGTESGKRLLAHELTHVLQQGNTGSIKPKTIYRSPDPAASTEDSPQIIKKAEKRNLARQFMVPFSFQADRELLPAKKDVHNHPLMIWAIAKIFELPEETAVNIVDSDNLVWFQDSKRKEPYKEGELVEFKITASTISNWLGVLSAGGQISPEAGDVFNELIALQSELSDRDYSFFLTWLSKENIPVGSITNFRSLTAENLEKIKKLIEQFKQQKYELLAGYGLLDDYLVTEDVIRDSRFEELKDSLFTKDLKQISAEEKTEILKLFQDKALTTTFVALEEAKIIGREEYTKYKNDSSLLQEIAETITSFSGGFTKNIELRIEEFLKFVDSYYDIVQVAPTTLSTPHTNSQFHKMRNIASTYNQLNKNIPELFRSYPGGKEEIIQLFSAKNCASVMAEALATTLVLYAWTEPENLKRNYYLPEHIDNPMFVKFKAQYPKPVRDPFDVVQNKCIPIIYETYPELAGINTSDEKGLSDMKIKADGKKHRILQDVSIDFRALAMESPDTVKMKIMSILEDKPVKAEKTKARLINKPELVWEFQPLLYYVLGKEGLNKTHPIYTIVDNKIKAVADRNFWESLALGALGLVLGVAGIFTGGITTALGVALLAGSVTVSLIDFVSSYEDYAMHADAYAATLKVPFTDDPSAIGVILSLAGLVLDMSDFLKIFSKTSVAAAKAAKTGLEATEESIGMLLANSKNIDEYANHLYEFANSNKLLKPGVTKEMFIKNITDNWGASQKLIESWKMREGIIATLPADVKALVDSPEFMNLPVEIRESIFKIYDADKDAFIKVMKSANDPNLLKPIGFQIFRNPDVSKVYGQLSQLMNANEFEKVVRYYSTVGIQTADTLPEVLNLMNAGRIFRDADLPVQVLTNRNVQQVLLHFHNSPESFITIWDNYVAKYSRSNPVGFAEYIAKETEYSGLAKMKEVSNPTPTVIGTPAYKGILTDIAGGPPKIKALEGLNEDLTKLKQSVKDDPMNVRDVTDLKYLDDYDVEVRGIGQHTFRRNKHTGRWCRFSIEVCNIDVDDELDQLVDDVHDTRVRSGTEEVGVDPRTRGYAIEDFQLEYLEKSGWKGLEDYYPRIDFYHGGMETTVVKKGKTVTEIHQADVVSVKSTWITNPSDLRGKIDTDLSKLSRNYYANRSHDFIFRNVSGKHLHLIFEQGFLNKVIDDPKVLKVLEDMTQDAASRGIVFEWFVIPADGAIRNGPAFMREIEEELAEL